MEGDVVTGLYAVSSKPPGVEPFYAVGVGWNGDEKPLPRESDAPICKVLLSQERAPLTGVPGTILLPAGPFRGLGFRYGLAPPDTLQRNLDFTIPQRL
jgi:hypothetical protein